MSMFERCAGGLTLVFEQQNIAQTPVLFKVFHTLPERPQYLLNRLLRKIRDAQRMLRPFDDDFMCADSLHLVEESFTFALQITFNPEHREFVGDHPQRPSGLIGARAVPVSEHLRRGLAFVTWTERTEAAGGHSRGWLANEIRGSPRPIGGDNDP